MTHFNDFLQQFTKVANQFKSGNREVFLKDLETRIADVNYTKHILIHQQQQQNQHENQIEQDSDDLVSVTVRTHSPNQLIIIIIRVAQHCFRNTTRS